MPNLHTIVLVTTNYVPFYIVAYNRTEHIVVFSTCLTASFEDATGTLIPEKKSLHHFESKNFFYITPQSENCIFENTILDKKCIL